MPHLLTSPLPPRSPILLVALWLSLSLFGVPVRAAPSGGTPKPGEAVRKKKPSRAVVAEARRRFTRANKLYRQGNYNEALLIYQAALDLFEEPVILYNMAQTYEKLRDPGMAAHSYERYLKLRPGAPDDQKIKLRIADLRRRARVPVNITSYPPGAAIFLDSRDKGVRGRTPFTLKVPIGAKKIILELAGFLPEERDITVELGQQNNVDVQLRRRTSVRVDADVPGAKARLGKEEDGESNKLPHLFAVSPGKHVIWVGRKGYHPVTQEVEVEEGQQLSLLVNLKALPKYGQLQIEGVKGATVILEGRTFDHLPMKPKQLAEGNYNVQVTREGYRTWESRVNVSHKRLTVARVNLTRYRSTAMKATIYGAAGVAAASLVTGAVMGVLAFQTDRDYKSNPTKDLQETGSTQALMADIFVAGAAAGALVAVISYFVSARGPSSANVSLIEASP